MAINIKEIFDGDSQAQQIDKINYNFDQILANGGGPIGATGAQGASGATGSTGPQGAQGPIGPKGDPGDYTDFFVGDALASSTYSGTIFTKTDGSRPSNIVIGDLSATSINSPAPYDASNIKFVSDSYLGRAIRFDTNGNDSNYIDVVFKDSGSARTLDFLSSAVGSDVVYGFNGKGLDLNFNGSSFIDFNKDGSLIGTDVNFNSGNTVEFNGIVEFNDPNVVDPTGKVLKAANSDGKFEWGNASVVPVGTMVMAPKFVVNNCVELPNTSTNYRGRGKDGGVYGDWRGWYMCNGETWWDGGSVEFDAPDLRLRIPRGIDDSLQGMTLIDNPGGNADQSFSIPAHNHSGSTVQIGHTSKDSGQTTFDAMLQPQNNTPTSQSNFPLSITSEPSHTRTINLLPEVRYVTYMIYLGPDNLTHKP